MNSNIARKKLLTESFEIKGLWFNIDEKLDSNSIAGTLKYTPQGITLELFGALRENEINRMYVPQESVTIWGFTNNGEYITLFDCYEKARRESYPGFTMTEYSIGSFLSGKKYFKNADGIAGSITVSFTNLNAWMRQETVDYLSFKEFDSIKIPKKQSRDNMWVIDIPSEKITITEEFSSGIVNSKEFLTNEKKSVLFNKLIHIKTEDGRSLSLDQVLHYAQSIQKVMTALVGEAMYFTLIDLSINNLSDDKDNTPATISNCRFFFNQAGDSSKVKSLSPWNERSFLIKKVDVDDRIGYIFNKWFENKEPLSEIIGPYVSNKFIPSYLETYFINIASSLEAYHRVFVEKEGEGKEESFTIGQSLIIDYIDNSIDSKWKEFFKSKINVTDSCSFRSRIKSLVKGLPSRLNAVLFNKEPLGDTDRMVSYLVDTRNYHTHKDSAEKYHNLIKNPYDLHRITKKLEIMLVYYFLTSIGVSERVAENGLIERARWIQ